MATERLKTPMLFACAARVKIPQLGSEDSDMKGPLKSSRYAPASIVFKGPQAIEPLSKNYLSKISTDLTFEEAVVRERCFHALPYDEKYMEEIFDLSGLISPSPQTSIPVGRHNARGGDKRHMPCNLTTSTKPHLKPLKRKIMERAQQMHLEAVLREELIEKRKLEREEKATAKFKERHESKEQQQQPRKGFFITEEEEADDTREPKGVEKKEVKIKEPEKEKVTEVIEGGSSDGRSDIGVPPQDGNHWDSYLMSLLSTNTANWIVHKKTPVGSKDYEKLTGLLKSWYGEPEHTDLVREETSDNEADEPEKEVKPKKKWKKKEATLLEKVYQIEDAPAESLDPYSDDNKAPFYRQPAGLRRARKHEEKEELGAINTTAAVIDVKTFQPSPPPTLRDFMNPAVGDKVIDTDNMFQQEQLTGTTQIHDSFGDPTKIQMESNNKYKKKLQSEYPKQPQHWYPETDEEIDIKKKDAMKRRKFERGQKRWKELPEPIDDTAELLKVLPPGADVDFQKSADPRARKTAKSNASLLQIIDEWRTKWHLTGQFADSNPDDLIRDMADIQSHVRLKAIATCGKASDYKPPVDHGIQLEYQERAAEEEALPEKLFLALECLLDDPVDKVRKASAITLYSLSRVSDKATDILYEALQSANPIDRWAAAQCLAHFGVCDSDVVGEILRQVMNTEDTIKHERGISMLGTLSVASSLVHSMVAEQLNSSSWRHKIIACKILPTLRGDINKDITNKLADLMWNDWHSEVRRAAAQCLGKTGHGREVHDDLRERILGKDEKIKLEAINKVGQLGIMTAKLLPAFLQCFNEEYVSIRSEMCITCGNLAIQDENVIEKLVQLATFDTIWKIKALAFQALGKIGVINDEIVECLLWAVRYEERPGVRAEACHTLKVLGVRRQEVADVLQERFLVESSQLVRDEIASALKMFDISATEDMDMVAQIKKEVRKLCTRNIIAGQITLNERDDDRRENLARMIYETDKELQPPPTGPQGTPTKNKRFVVGHLDSQMNHCMARNHLNLFKHVLKDRQIDKVLSKDQVEIHKNLGAELSHICKSLSLDHLKMEQLESVTQDLPNILKVYNIRCKKSKSSDTMKEKVNEKPLEPVMERLRSMSRSESRSDSNLRTTVPEASSRSTPEPGRDGVVFTPTADHELEAILSKEEISSGVTSPAGSSATPGLKSGATSASLPAVDDEEDDEEDEEGKEEKDEEAKEDQQEQSSTPGKSSALHGSEEEREEEGEEEGEEGTSPEEGETQQKPTSAERLTSERPTSVVKFASHLEVADIPSRSRSPLVSSHVSMSDEPKISRIGSFVQNGDRNMVFSRDAVEEREKVNVEARNTFAAMDFRYQDMVEYLIDLDNTFELGLTSGSRADFERTIENVRIVQTPPSGPNAPLQIVLTVDEVVDVEGPVEDVDEQGNIINETTDKAANTSESKTNQDLPSSVVSSDGDVSDIRGDASGTKTLEKQAEKKSGSDLQQETTGNQSQLKIATAGSSSQQDVSKSE